MEPISKSGDCSQKPRKGPRGGVTTPFPEKLHDVLSDGKYADIVSWQPHGRCFLLHKPHEFLHTVLSKHFRQSKLTSFQRQLNLYGFNRINQGPDKGGYYHEFFLRGKRSLCARMIRVRVKGKDNRAVPSPEVPDFYNTPPVDCEVGESDASTMNDMGVYTDDTTKLLLRGESSMISVTSSTSFVSNDSVIPVDPQDSTYFSTALNHERKRAKGPLSPKFVGVSISIPMSPSVKSQASSKTLESLDLDEGNHIPVQDELVMFEGKSFHYIESRCVQEKQDLFQEKLDEIKMGRCRSVTFDEDSIYSTLKRELLTNAIVNPNSMMDNLVFTEAHSSPDYAMTMDSFTCL